MITLVGFPGAGKSTVGRAVAERHPEYRFVDTDTEMETVLRCPLPEALARRGEAAMAHLEREVLLECARRFRGERVVLATGGSAVHYPEAVRALMAASVVVYLRAPREVLAERTENFTNRAIFFGGKGIDQWYAERNGLYDAASHRSVSSDRELGVVADEVHRVAQFG